MSDDRTRASTPHPAMPPADAAATAADGRAVNPDITRAQSRPLGDPSTAAVTIPGYEVHGELARGGMGRVLQAYDRTFGREVAIKVVLPGPDAGAIAGRFVRESRITGQLTHPGIPPAYQLGELPDGSPFLAMKLVRGCTLADLLEDRPNVGQGLPRFVAVFEQVCQAVGYAHNRRVIHRDLKPANVMVGSFGEVLVMDWGLAKVLTAADEPEGRDGDHPDAHATSDGAGATLGDDRTRAGAVMGTPAYMAPEQARGGDVDARADVFALGGLLSSILVGRAPFWSGDVQNTLVLASSGNTSDVLAALDGCGADAELVDLTRRCLAPEPAARPADGTAVASLVSAYRAGVEERLRAAERDRAAAEAKAAEGRKRRRVQLGLAAAVVLLVAGGGAVAVWRVDEDGKKRADSLRLEGEERERKARAADAVAALLNQAQLALDAGDADRAAPLLDQAARRATDGGVTDQADRLAAFGHDLAMLRRLDLVDDFRWTPKGKVLPSNHELVEQWAAAFAAYGIVPGTTPAAESAARIGASSIKKTLVTTLDRWLAQVPTEPVRAAAAAADPDPFRNEVRGVLSGGGSDRLAALAERPEWDAQALGLVKAYASSDLSGPVRRAFLLRIVQTRPADFGVVMMVGETKEFFMADGAAERVRWYQAAVALRPRSVAANYNLGVALADLGDRDGAVAAYRAAIRVDPDYYNAYSVLAAELRDKGDLDAAIAAFRHAVRLAPTHALHWFWLGDLLQRTGDPEGSIAAYREAVHLDGNFRGVAIGNLADLLDARGRYREALDVRRTIARIDPKNEAAHVSVGDAHIQADGDFGAAAAAYEEAARVDPRFARTHVRLGDTYRKLGRLTEAEAAYRAALARESDLESARDGLNYLTRLRRGLIPTAPPPRAVGR